MRITKCPQCNHRQSFTNRFCGNCQTFLNPIAEITFSKQHMNLVMGFVIALTLIISLSKAVWKREERIEQIRARATNAAIPTPPEITETESERRRKFASGMQALTDESKASSYTIRNVRYTTEGSEDIILVLTANNISERDCRFLASSEYGKRAFSIGFHKLICRNLHYGNQWAVNLQK